MGYRRYRPSQPRGPDGKWISTGAKKAVRRSTRSKQNKKKYAARRKPRNKTPFKIDKASSRQDRGVGVGGLKKNFIPHARISKKSVTVGFNTGAFVPGSNKRVVIGNYARIESVNKKGSLDKAASKVLKKLAPERSKRGAVVRHIKQNAKLDNPAIRYSSPGTASREGIQARLGTSRKAGPTIIVRRGTHKRTKAESKSGIKSYNKSMRTIQGKKVSQPRPTRRRQAAAKKNRKKRNR